MTLLYIIFAFWALFVLFDFKKAVLCYAPFKLLFYYDVRLTASLPFDMAIMLLIAFCFCFKRKHCSDIFPFRKGYIAYGIIYSIGCIIPVFAANRIPATIISILLYSYIYFQCIKNMRDVRLAAFSYMGFSIFLAVNGLYELVTQSCPVAEWINSMPYIDKEHAWDTNFEFLRFGLPRIKSFMAFSISFGVACAIMLAIPYCLMFNSFKAGFIMKLLVPASLVLLLVGVVIAGSRSPIMGVVVLGAYLVWDKKIWKKHKRKIILSGILFFIFMWPYIYANIMSVIAPEMAEEVGGSSVEMRNGQYAIAWKYMMQSPLIGLGKNTEITDTGFFGGESIWLPLMINGGVLAIFGYVYLYYSIVKSTKLPDSKFLHIVTASWLLMNTATSLMGIGDATYLTIYMLLYRYFQLNSRLCSYPLSSPSTT